MIEVIAPQSRAMARKPRKSLRSTKSFGLGCTAVSPPSFDAGAARGGEAGAQVGDAALEARRVGGAVLGLRRRPVKRCESRPSQESKVFPASPSGYLI